MIIDCHCHAGKGDGLTGPWDTSAPLRDFMRWSRRAGIDRTNLFAAFHTDYAVANRQVAAIVAANPTLFYGFAMIDPRNDAGRVEDLVRVAVRRYGFRGIKVHRIQSGITREVCETAARWSLPILYDVAGAVSQIELLAGEYPNINFIIPHLGSFSDDWRAQLALIDHLVRHPNIFADTSAVRRFDLLLTAVRRAGPRKFLFGSDGPWTHPGVELEKIKALAHELKLSHADRQLILGKNFLRLIRPTRRNNPPIGPKRLSAAAPAGRSRFSP